AREQLGPEPLLLGNIDPVAVLRNGKALEVSEAIRQCHRGAGERYVVGAGCEVVRDSPHANVRALVDYARGHRCDGSERGSTRPDAEGTPSGARA
ncbi:MAG: uroporphyrinogen decarboxylase family protein, partial [Planctomycetota bacterium]